MEERDLTPDFLSLVQIDQFEKLYQQEISANKYFGMPLAPLVSAERRLISQERCVAYFSMEYGLASSFYNTFTAQRPIDPKNKCSTSEVFSNYRLADYFFTLSNDRLLDLPIYSGGLGVLAGDTTKTMADYRVPAVAIGILWSTGYFRQKFWFKYGQLPEEMSWDPFTYPGLIPLKNKIKISLRSQDLYLRLWNYYVYSYRHDHAIPLILLDTDVDPNSENDKRLTDQLYRSDSAWIKAMQRVILGLGGIAALRELGYNIDLYHLNEGHAVFAFVERTRGMNKKERDSFKKHFVYTCHTPVEAGHDKFLADDLRHILKDEDFEVVEAYGKERSGLINLTLFSMNIASAVNAVAKRHHEVMKMQFPKYKDVITYVTNGVHSHTWMSQQICAVLESFPAVFGDFKANPMALIKAKDLMRDLNFRCMLWDAHQANKVNLCSYLEHWGLRDDVLTICWARRIAAYKRPSLILNDIKRLIQIARMVGPIQIIFAGKAHPRDNLGFTFVNEMLDKIDSISEVYDYLKIIMLENYDIYLAKLLVSGVDIWLNNPLPPFEASGTSGMKALLNGVIQVSTLDGWVVEAEDKGIGKIFGYRSQEGKIGSEQDLHMREDAQELYLTLEEMIRLYYRTYHRKKVDIVSEWLDYMVNCLAAASHFNTYRMLDEYKQFIWKMP